MIDWLLLTGGSSSRLGQDKASTSVGGRTLLQHAQETIERVDPTGRVLILGPEYGGGPAAAVVVALSQCDADVIGVLAVDMPMAGSALCSTLQALDDESDGWIPVAGDGRRQWLCALYRRSALLRAAGEMDWTDQPFHRLVANLACMNIHVDSTASLLDVDTPEDLVRAQVQIKEQVEERGNPKTPIVRGESE